MTPHSILTSRVLGVVALLFGLLTIKSGLSVLLDLGTARAEHPNYVPFVLWFNALSGVVYVTAGIGLWLRRRWAAHLAVALVLGLVATCIGLGVHVLSGGAYDRSTLVAMSVRLLVWIAIAAFAWFALRPRASGPTVTDGATTSLPPHGHDRSEIP
jgi:hypothetical protein